MRAIFLLLLICIGASCSNAGPDAAPAAPSNQTADTSCGARPEADADDLAMCMDTTLSPEEIARHQRLAATGDIQAIFALAWHFDSEGRKSEARRWLALAAEHGDCNAVRWLNEETMMEGVAADERRRWQEEDRRRKCSIERWARSADGGAIYARPDLPLWLMRVDCLNGVLHVSGSAGMNVPENSLMTYRTLLGEQRRHAVHVEFELGTMAFRARPDDEVLAALVRGETIRAGRGSIDGRGAAPFLRPLLEHCGENVRASADASRAR